ncbi:MAG: class I SAM-dependent methyltransferase [Clostridiales bacterium]|nr:class I SAM-dependent methyltransferase [Clostridiales bacterium]
MKKLWVFGFCLWIFLLPAEILSQEKWLDVPYVPTKPEVVEEMLRMAKVGKNDILYDLGCGDGRIVITAARLYGTRGVGVDIDPDRIRESRENAAQAGVSDLVKFLEQDLFETDFHEATVVSLYLLTSVNVRLRPKLFAQLKPGTRVVSHNYAMETWKPDQSSIVMVDEMTHDVYLWIVPANVSGTWVWTWPEISPNKPCRVEMEQLFQFPHGKAVIDGEELPLRDVHLEGENIRFTVDREKDKKAVIMTFEGRARGHTIEGNVSIRDDGKLNRTSWKATRQPATMKPLDEEADIN